MEKTAQEKEFNPYESPTLVHLEDPLGEPVRPDGVACRDCPVSVWYYAGEGALSCFCPVLHQIKWDGHMPAVQFCDGREKAVAKLFEDLNAPTRPAR